ncbi:MAG: hypothetical protein R3C32_02800 [Chloroflexota bacterium]
MPVTDPGFRAFLDTPGRYATIATLDPDGGARQAVVWYALEEDGSVLLNSREGRRWPGNLVRDLVSRWSSRTGPRTCRCGASPRCSTGARRPTGTSSAWPALRDGDHLAEMLATFRGQHRISFRFDARSESFHP